MKNIPFALISTALAVAGLSTLAQAEDPAVPNPAYLVDGEGKVVTSGYGECWRTGEWRKDLATAPCDPVAKPVPVADPAPEPEPPPPPPAPEPEAAPIVIPVPVPEKVSFSGDALFPFDKADLRPESRALLDELVQKLEGTTPEMLTVTGHTDRLGPPAYNQRLSERRALTVKNYLVSKNIPAERIQAQGLGETQPMTTAADCKGTRATAKLIACLQADRRVDVEMSGTKAPDTTGAAETSQPPAPAQ
ncbi:MAG: OmpA family protein [Rhodoferax sp.]|nr:OmpA family protein [Rhodoferax sp.]